MMDGVHESRRSGIKIKEINPHIPAAVLLADATRLRVSGGPGLQPYGVPFDQCDSS